MIRALRQSEHLTEAHVALATLALTTARALDEVVASSEKRYVVAQLSRAHLLALEALVSVPEPSSPDVVDQFLADLLIAAPSDAEGDDRL